MSYLSEKWQKIPDLNEFEADLGEQHSPGLCRRGRLNQLSQTPTVPATKVQKQLRIL